MHINMDALRALDQPNFLRFLLNSDGSSMIMEPYHKLEFQSIRVPKDIDRNLRRCRFRCAKLCRLFTYALKWNPQMTYRIPGKIISAQKIVVFDMTQAKIIYGSDSMN